MIRHNAWAFMLAFCAMHIYSTALALPEDRAKPIESTADKTTIDLMSNTSILIGNVIIKQGMLTIYADKVELKNDPINNQLTFLHAIGKPVLMVDTPQLNQPSIEISGNSVQYFPKDSKLITLGNATIVRKSSIAKGEKIEYNSLTGIMSIQAKRVISGVLTDKQAELVIEPETIK